MLLSTLKGPKPQTLSRCYCLRFRISLKLNPSSSKPNSGLVSKLLISSTDFDLAVLRL